MTQTVSLTVNKGNYYSYKWVGGTDTTSYTSTTHVYTIPKGTEVDIDWDGGSNSSSTSDYIRRTYSYSDCNNMVTSSGYPGGGSDKMTISSNTTVYPATSRSSTLVSTEYLYEITYNANGGSGAPSTTSSSSTSTSRSITLASGTPTRAHYTFLGWATSSTATTPTYQPSTAYTFSYGLTQLYAVWQEDPRYNVTIEPGNYGAFKWVDGDDQTEYSAAHTYNVYTGTTMNIDWTGLPTEVTTQNYIVTTRTYTNETLMSTSNAYPGTGSDSVTIDAAGTYYPANAMTYTESYQYQYDIEFDANGGTGAPSPITATLTVQSSTFTLPTTVPTRTDRRFLGWSATQGATHEDYLPGQTYTFPYGLTTLYAVWNPVGYLVTFVSSDPSKGSVSSQSILASEGSQITVSGNSLTVGGVTVKAIPTEMSQSTCYYLSSWSNVLGTITQPRTVTANFASISPRTITLNQGSNYILSTADPSSGAIGVKGVRFSGNDMYIASKSEYDLVELGKDSRTDDPIVMMVTPGLVTSGKAFNSTLNAPAEPLEEVTVRYTIVRAYDDNPSVVSPWSVTINNGIEDLVYSDLTSETSYSFTIPRYLVDYLYVSDTSINGRTYSRTVTKTPIVNGEMTMTINVDTPPGEFTLFVDLYNNSYSSYSTSGSYTKIMDVYVNGTKVAGLTGIYAQAYAAQGVTVKIGDEIYVKVSRGTSYTYAQSATYTVTDYMDHGAIRCTATGTSTTTLSAWTTVYEGPEFTDNIDLVLTNNYSSAYYFTTYVNDVQVDQQSIARYGSATIALTDLASGDKVRVARSSTAAGTKYYSAYYVVVKPLTSLSTTLNSSRVFTAWSETD